METAPKKVLPGASTRNARNEIMLTIRDGTCQVSLRFPLLEFFFFIQIVFGTHAILEIPERKKKLTFSPRKVNLN